MSSLRMEHTKGTLEYSVYRDTDIPATLFIDEDGEDIDLASFKEWEGENDELVANVERLRLCWNAHDDLVAAVKAGCRACQNMNNALGIKDECESCRATTALKAAKGDRK